MTPQFLRSRRTGLRGASAALLLGSLATLPAHAGSFDKNPGKAPIAPVQEPEPLYLGTVTSGVKTSDVYTEGNFSLVVPVYSSLGAEGTLSGDVLYLEPYTSWGEGGEVAASLGLGWRHLFGSQPTSALYNKDAGQAGFMEEGFFVGANFFVDMLDTEANNQFWQLGVGLEIGNRYLEVRGNYYIPLSEKQLAEETRTREILRSSSSRDNTSLTPLNDPYATGNTIAQDGLWSTTRTTTTTTTTIDRLFRRYEEGMEGWDAEVAVLVPGLDKYFDLRLIGGYYSFDNQPFGPQTGGTGNVEGFKAGVEIRPVPAVILSGTWYEDDRLTGSDWTAGVQLQLPFEMGDLGDGKGFWGRIGDAFKPRRRHLAERMAEPVHRQNAAIKVANTVDVDTKTSTNTKRVTKVVSQRQGQIVLADDIVFVNNGEAVGNGIQAGDTAANGANGTAERPFDSIPEGAAVAGNNSNTNTQGRIWNVYTQGGTGTNYTDYTEVSGSTRFISSYNAITGLGGTKFGGNTPRPVYEGIFYVNDIDTFSVRGYHFLYGSKGATVIANNSAYVEVRDNVFQDVTDFGVWVETYDIAKSTVIVENNTFNNSFDESSAEPVRFDVGGTSVIDALVRGNEFQGYADNAISGYVHNSGTLNVKVQNNSFDGNIDGALASFETSPDGDFEDNGVLNLEFTGNRTATTLNYSDGVEIDTSENTTANVLVANNLFFGDSDDSVVELTSSDFSTINATIRDNRFGGYVSDETIDFESEDDSKLTAIITGNTFPGDLNQVLDGEKSNRSVMDITFTNNVLNGDYDESAIELTGSDGNNGGAAKLIAVISENLFNGDFDDEAIQVEKEENALVDVTIGNNRFQGDFENNTITLDTNGGEGPNNRMIATITGNQFRGIHNWDGGTGAIHLDAEDGSKLDASITENIFEGTFYDNLIDLEAIDGSRVQVTIADNRMRNVATADGAFVYAEAYDDGNIVIQNFNRNLIRGIVYDGLVLDEYNDGRIRVDGTLNPAATNEITNFQFDLIRIPSSDPAGSFFLNGTQVDLP